MLNSGSALTPEAMGAAEVSRAGEGHLTTVGGQRRRQPQAGHTHHRGGRQSRAPRPPVPCTLILAQTALPHPAVPRLSEQTLLVEKLTEQNASERAISSLRTNVQRLVRGWEGAAGGRGLGLTEQPPTHVPPGVPAQRRRPGSPGGLESRGGDSAAPLGQHHTGAGLAGSFPHGQPMGHRAPAVQAGLGDGLEGPMCLSPGLCPLCALKVAQADAGSEELMKSNGAEGEGAQGQRRSTPHAESPLTAESLPPAHSPVTLDSALSAVRAAIQRRRQREQVGTEPVSLRRAAMGLPMTPRRLTPGG